MLNKKGIRKMLFVGIIFGCSATIIAHLYAVKDYWHPIYLMWPFNIEDFLYGFFYGGIIASFYEVVFHRQRKNAGKFNTIWFLIFCVFSIASFLIITTIFKINSIVAHILPPILVSMVVCMKRPDLIKPSLFTAIMTLILTAGVFVVLQLIYPGFFGQYWYLGNLSGVRIGGIPIEELLFAFFLGFGGSHFYEFLFGYRLEP